VARSEIASFYILCSPAYNTVIVFRNKISPIFFFLEKMDPPVNTVCISETYFPVSLRQKNWEETISIFKFFLQIWMLTLCSFLNSSTGKMYFCFSMFIFFAFVCVKIETSFCTHFVLFNLQLAKFRTNSFCLRFRVNR
jgi:hypothetical protein